MKINISKQKIKIMKLFFLSVLFINIIYILTYESNLKSSINDIIIKTTSSSSSSLSNKSELFEEFQQNNIISTLTNTRSSSSKFLSYLKTKINILSSLHPKTLNIINKLEKDTNYNEYNDLNSNLIIYKNHTNYWNNQKSIFYDPRFTLSMYLHEFKLQYLEKQSNHQKEPIVELPFNWVDWMDLTLLIKDILETDPSKQITCDTLVENSENEPDGSKFCMNKNEINDLKLSQLNYTIDQLPNFIIWAHEAHTKRIYNDYRILQAKSFAMLNMKSPLKVFILNDEGTYEFNVIGNNRINQTPFLENYLNNHKLKNKSKTKTIKSEISINHIKELKNLQSIIKPKIETPTQKNDDFEIYLNESMFHPISIETKLKNLPSNPSNFTPQQQLIYNGLIKAQEFSSDKEPRFFKMATLRIDDSKNLDYDWGWHYDWRFFNGALNYNNGLTLQDKTKRISIILDRLLRNWSKFAQSKGIIWWIMHGPLLSWYWNGMMFPFDIDIDIQMPVSELYKLNDLYNNTLVVENPREGFGKFLIETNTFLYNREFSGGDNYIDARFIDVDSGIYIDITGLSKSKSFPQKEYNEYPELDIIKTDENDEIYNDRRKHFYKLNQLSPLKFSYLQSIPVLIPNEIETRLKFEYPKGLTDLEYSNWYFIDKLNSWIHIDDLKDIFKFENYKKLKKDSETEFEWDKEKIKMEIPHISNEKIFKFLINNEKFLLEFYKIYPYTQLHEIEMNLIAGLKNDEILEMDFNNDILKNYLSLSSKFKQFNEPLRTSLWEFEMDIKRNKEIKE
ncbi:uncharacterized protein KGF55_001627 [Candida pseudojiufengensis]|uniref:uncharacterized protein n=1 Tax=Candida pseudojiufengensis TaxID=497109 RepID=UPI002225AE49|nr:uncharacterized protein KGF55_001627 [Candida pseudojiufengensis]KAI5965406.1 hypothetical protein KGF55_001627 [Candida pseudojiufengensis]